ncbi:MAG: hypothetical protein JWQ09_6104 [Segetibacter sp.]|nr:hypothetical protein [Segetibacter sp.]
MEESNSNADLYDIHEIFFNSYCLLNNRRLCSNQVPKVQVSDTTMWIEGLMPVTKKDGLKRNR